MIVRPDGAAFVVITQSDHAHFGAELLSLWRADGLPDHPRRRELLFAVREHDNGWWEADAAPRLDRRTGRPYDFLSIPREDRVEIWRRGVRRHAEAHPYAALLIAHHAWALHRDRRTEPGYPELLEEIDDLQVELRERSGIDEDRAGADYRFLDLADFLSLVVSNRWGEPFAHRGVSGRFADGTLVLDPFRLAGATTFRLPRRRIQAREYRGDADLGGELAAARWEEETVRVTPG